MEQYLKENRHNLDVESPDDQAIWEGIREGLKTRKGRGELRWIRFRNIAAVLLIGLSLGYLVNDLIHKRRPAGRMSLVNIDQELGEREKEYQQLISLKENEAGLEENTQSLIIAEIVKEFSKLDAIYYQCLEDLDEPGYDERIINTIFDTYEKKLYLLELIILEKNKIKRYENKKEIQL